jgi:hypothetical protein
MVLDQCIVASKAFTSALVESLKTSAEADAPAEEVKEVNAKKVN